MEIVVRRVTNYKNVEVKEGQTTIDFGLCSPDECLEIAKVLKAGIEHLIDDQEKCKEFLTSDE
jgi:hypothetical protein